MLSWCVDTLCVGRISHCESPVHGHELFKINNPFVYQISVSPYGSIVFFVCVSVCVCFYTYLHAFHDQGFFASGRTHYCLLYSKFGQPDRRRLSTCYRAFIARSDGGQMSVPCDFCSHCRRSVEVHIVRCFCCVWSWIFVAIGSWHERVETWLLLPMNTLTGWFPRFPTVRAYTPPWNFSGCPQNTHTHTILTVYWLVLVHFPLKAV